MSRCHRQRRRRRRRRAGAAKSSGYPTATSSAYVFTCTSNIDSRLIPRRPQLGPERHRAPEVLFNPEIVGLEYAGVHQVVVDSINRADLDLRKSLFGNVVLSGGGTLVKGT